MYGPTRCYPIGDLTPLLCAARNAQSRVPELGVVAMHQLLEHLRPRVRRYAAPLVAGLRGPSVCLDVHVEHALVSVGASLAQCTAVTDCAFYGWVSSITSASVLEQHTYHASRQLQRRRSALMSRRPDDRPDTARNRGNAA